MKKNEVKKAKVRGTDRIVSVYKLKDGAPTPEHVWHIFLGDNISLSAIEQGMHNETFKESELDFQ